MRGRHVPRRPRPNRLLPVGDRPHAANVATLKLHWTAKGGTGTFAQPIVANNLVYWGDWNGFEHATDLTGNDVWTVRPGRTSTTTASHRWRGQRHSDIATMGSTSVVYVPGGDENMYTLNALTGAVIWKTNLGTPTADYLWGSPVLFNGSIYEAVASFGDCPLVQGRLVQMDATTGAIQHVANMVPNGCVGGGIWTSPAVDPSDGSIYVTTGTPNACSSPGELAPSIVKLRASDLAILSSWTVPQSVQVSGDTDFGGTPTLFTATINGVARALVGALNKDGISSSPGTGATWPPDRYGSRRSPIRAGARARSSPPPGTGSACTWGGGAIINGTSCYGNISALDPATGAFVWRSCAGLHDSRDHGGAGHAHRG